MCDHHQSKKRLEYFEYTLVLLRLLRLRRLRRRRRLKTRRIRRRPVEEEEDFCRRNANGPDGLYSRESFFFQHEYTYYSKEDLSLASSEKESSSSSSSSSSASRSFRSFSNCRLDLISTSMKSLGSVNPSVSLSKPSMAPTL